MINPLNIKKGDVFSDGHNRLHYWGSSRKWSSADRKNYRIYTFFDQRNRCYDLYHDDVLRLSPIKKNTNNYVTLASDYN